jgi:hypothetical protein
MKLMKAITSARTPLARAQASHCCVSTRICKMNKRLINAELSTRTEARSSARLTAATTHVPLGSRFSPSRHSSSSK